jgi:hypothetical protein
MREVIFDEYDSFTRCPRCLQLCEWELVDTAVMLPEMAAVEQ